jgi:carbonic anhydrase
MLIISIAIAALAFCISEVEAAGAWNYNNGGLDWVGSSNACGGASQSPVAIEVDLIETLESQNFDFELSNQPLNTTFTIDDNIRFTGAFSNIKFTDDNGTDIEFECDNFQLHAPSEHYVNGRLYDAELQIIHTVKPAFVNSTSYTYAIVSILFEAKENERNAFLDALDLKNTTRKRVVNFQDIFWNDFKSLSSYVYYPGSLTVPDCNETAYWFVFNEPILIGIDQLTVIDKNFRGNPKFAGGRGNNRLVQRLNSRTPYYVEYEQKVISNLKDSAFFATFLSTLLK